MIFACKRYYFLPAENTLHLIKQSLIDSPMSMPKGILGSILRFKIPQTISKPWRKHIDDHIKSGCKRALPFNFFFESTKCITHLIRFICAENILGLGKDA